MSDPVTPVKSTGAGVTVSISTDGSTYTQFGSVSSVGGPSMSRGTIDVSDLNSYSGNNKFKEYLPDFVEGGDVKVNGWFLSSDAGRDAADTAFYGDNEVYIKIVFPTKIGKTAILQGVPTGYEVFGELTPSGGIAYSFTVKLTHKPTISATA